MEVINTVISFLTVNFSLIIQIVGVAALIATKTPNKSDDKIVQIVLDLVNFLGANVGEAKNTD